VPCEVREARPSCVRDWLVNAELTLLAEVFGFGIFDFSDCRSLGTWPALLAGAFIVEDLVESSVNVLVYGTDWRPLPCTRRTDPGDFSGIIAFPYDLGLVARPFGRPNEILELDHLEIVGDIPPG
jgi:hypothetical protein